ncbi:MAG: hypothetical protein LQ348_004573 [Seirophora lacunosa]|nr:MAG: hypothetical protein LQ348_004573 [Seirophora lacunosa]
MSSTQQKQIYPSLKPQLKSLLDRHRILAPSAGVRVSPICLGAMNFGNAWKDFMGECSKETAWEMLDYFYDMGGNFIDTASNYQGEESEQWLGEWMEERGRRDEMVVATKYCGMWKMHEGTNHMLQSNFGGGASKNLHVCVEASLKKLRTTYIDLLYVHFWDMTTGVEEMMQSLNHLVQAGKVLYLGISDTPAWFVVKANDYARHHGLRPFSVYQGRWSAAERDFERDIIPMCMDQGMGLCPWGALGGGYFKPQAQVHSDGGRKFPGAASTNAARVSETLERVAGRKGTLMTSVALAYVLQKAPYVFPICGGRKVEHLRGNIEALGLKLTREDVEEIERAYPFEVGFPMGFLGGSADPKDNSLANLLGTFDYVEGPKAIEPADSSAA